MSRYHVLWEAEFEADEEWARMVAARQNTLTLWGYRPEPDDTLIVTEVEEPVKLPTAVGSIIGTSKPWAVLHSDGRWHSLKMGRSYSPSLIQSELDTGRAHYKVIFDAGKVAA